MKNVYLNIINKLQADVPELKWIDLDKGQMNYDRPPVAFPAALITLEIPRAENMNSTMQQCVANVIVRLCFDFSGNTSLATPEAERTKSLAYFDLVEKVFNTLQGYGTSEMNSLARVNQFDEQRPDGYKVAGISFSTAFHQKVE